MLLSIDTGKNYFLNYFNGKGIKKLSDKDSQQGKVIILCAAWFCA
jgi:hypothetical protein